MSQHFQDEFPFKSIDFPGRTALRVDEIAEKLGVTDQHIANQVELGALTAIDMKGARSNKRRLRIPLEEYRNFILVRLTGEARRQFLKELPATTLQELFTEIETILKIRTVNER